MTWVAGLCEAAKSENEIFDFAIWYKIKNRSQMSANLIFGESKSKAKQCFFQKDIDNMKILAEKFPGAILVFATLKNELGATEKGLLRELAQWGREYDKQLGCQIAPVVILTGIELYSRYKLQTSWKNKGGKHAELLESFSDTEGELEQLANWTQQLYLDMECYYKVLIKRMTTYDS